MNDGIIGSMKELGVTESYKLKRQVVLSASEAAEMILRYVFFSSSPPHMQMLIIGLTPFQRGRHLARYPTETRGRIIV